MRIAIPCVLAAAAALVYLFAGRSLSLLADRLYTVPLAAPPLHRFRYDNRVLQFDAFRLYLLTPQAEPAPVTVTGLDSARVSIATRGKSFSFGPALSPLEFTPDPGDTVRFTLERSLLSWPTPFDLNFLTASSPSWKRHLYCRLRWTKPSHARLEMLWRVEQGYFGAGNWRPADAQIVTTGLLWTRIAD